VSEEKTKILLIEDDQSQGVALEEALKRSGFEVYWANHPDQAMNYVDEFGRKLSYVIADCLLPKTPGVELVVNLRKKLGGSFKALILSGIYTDKNFIKDAINKTQALAFFTKPFSIHQITELLKKEEEQLLADRTRKANISSRKSLYQVFSSPDLSIRQKRKILESLEDISGYDLPMIISLLSETRTSGFLNIFFEDGKVGGLSFFEGKITAVDVPDRGTFLGELLIQSGYINPDEVKVALEQKKKRKMGEYLIQGNLLSPHAFDLILIEQMSIRLSSIISDKKIRISFVGSENTEDSFPNIDNEALVGYLHDWNASKVSHQWLKSLFVFWSNKLISKNPLFKSDHFVLKMPLLNSLDGIWDSLDRGITINQMLENINYSEVAVYKGIHFLLIKGLIHFDKKIAFESEQSQLSHLERLSNEFEKKSDFEILDYFEASSGPANGQDLSAEIMNLLGEEPKTKSSVVHSVWQKLKIKLDTVLNLNQNSGAKEKAKKDSEKNENELKLKGTLLLEELKQTLSFNQFNSSKEIADKISQLGVEISGFHLLYAWTKLGTLQVAQKDRQLKEVELELAQVSPDERFGVHFSYVTALFYKAKGDLKVAEKQLRKCLAVDQNFILAKKELSLMQSKNKKQDLLTMDLKDVVTSLFRKK